MMKKSEEKIFNILSKYGNWRFVEMFDDGGKELPQAKQYDPPCWIAYPDFERIDGDKIILLVEAKGYMGFFDNRENTLAMKHRQFKQYFVAQNKEKVEVRVVFVLETNSSTKYYWETLNNIWHMEHYLEQYNREKYIFWNAEEFRTDIDNVAIL